jgi:hypothetical protein
MALFLFLCGIENKIMVNCKSRLYLQLWKPIFIYGKLYEIISY